MAEIAKANLEGLAKAAGIVAAGGLICYPTDTVYGLGCSPLNTQAVRRAMEAKGERIKPMPVLVRNLPAAEKLAYMSNRARALCQEFWPGPLTLVVEARDVVPSILAPDMKVGVRSPKHSICLSLLDLCSGALVGTSANLTGKPPATTAEEATRQVGDRVDLVLDGGRAPLGVASTIVDLIQPKLTILREGPIDREQILRALRKHRPR